MGLNTIHLGAMICRPGAAYGFDAIACHKIKVLFRQNMCHLSHVVMVLWASILGCALPVIHFEVMS